MWLKRRKGHRNHPTLSLSNPNTPQLKSPSALACSNSVRSVGDETWERGWRLPANRAYPALCHLGCLSGLCLWDQRQVWRNPPPSWALTLPFLPIISSNLPDNSAGWEPLSPFQRKKLRLAGNDEPSGPQSQWAAGLAFPDFWF